MDRTGILGTLKFAIQNRDVREIVGLTFDSQARELREGFFGEGQLWDYKEECPDLTRASDAHWADIAADVAAFHNQEGGVLLFGIRDRDFKFMGTRNRCDTKLFNDKIRRYVGDRFWVSYSRECIGSDQRYLGVAVIPPRSVSHVRMLADAPPINGKPAFKTGDLCIREADQTRVLHGSLAVEYAATKGLGASGATFVIDEPNFRILRPDYKQFVHRSESCDQIQAALKSNRTYVTSLTGIGGVGKTALACWATLRCHETKDFDFIVSVSARDRTLTSAGILAVSPTFSSLNDLVREICETTGFGEYLIIESEDERIERVKRDILAQFRGLLLVDNLETVDDPRIVEFLENLPIPSKALTTSRRAKIRIANFPVEVGPFSLEEAVSFFEETARSVGRPELAEMTKAEQQKVALACDRIPLVIEWFIGSASGVEKALKLADRIRAFGKHGEELLEFSFRRVYEEMTEAQRLTLQAIGLVNRPLPIEALAVAANVPIHSAADIVEDLKDYSLVERTYDTHYRDLVYSLLPVTTAFVCRELRKKSGVETEIRKRLTNWYDARDISDTAQRQLVQKVRRGESNPELALLHIAKNYVAQRDLNNAESYFKQALERNPLSYVCQREAAEFYRQERREVGRSLDHYRQAAELAPKQGPDRAKIFREFGIVLRNSGLPYGVREGAEQLKIALKETPGDVVCRHALGDCYVRMSQYELAIEVLLPLMQSKNAETRSMTYPLLERCYQSTTRLFELQQLRNTMLENRR